MAGYNHGKPVNFDDIKDYKQAAKDFAEGNDDLEHLLLNCFNKGIKTYACCGDGDELPYISFLYTEENMPYLYAILSKLKNKGYSFTYMKSSGNKNTFMIQEKSYDEKMPTSLFHEINEVICTFDDNKDYYGELPVDLQKYIDITNIARKNPILDIKTNKDYFQFYYQQNDEGYQYALLTNDDYYNSVAKISDFTRIDADWMYYNLQVLKREEASSSLNKIDIETQKWFESDDDLEQRIMDIFR